MKRWTKLDIICLSFITFVPHENKTLHRRITTLQLEVADGGNLRSRNRAGRHIHGAETLSAT